MRGLERRVGANSLHMGLVRRQNVDIFAPQIWRRSGALRGFARVSNDDDDDDGDDDRFPLPLKSQAE